MHHRHQIASGIPMTITIMRMTSDGDDDNGDDNQTMKMMMMAALSTSSSSSSGSRYQERSTVSSENMGFCRGLHG
jgi:hypothetical protein